MSSLIQNHDFPATTSKYLNFVVDLKRVDLKHAAAKFMSRSKVRPESQFSRFYRRDAIGILMIASSLGVSERKKTLNLATVKKNNITYS